MASDQATSRITRPPLPWALSFLAPAAVVLLPIFALAFAPGEKNEAYEWTQHELAGAGFAAAFAAAFLFGRWREGWAAALAALIVLAAVAMVTRHGLPAPHLLFAGAGVMVAAGYRFARRHDPPSLLEVFAVGFSSMLCFWANSRLSWWVPFDLTLASWPNQVLFLGVSALLVWLLCQLNRPEVTPGPGRVWTGRVIDLVTLTVLAAAVLRTNYLQGNPDFSHHWSVYVAPAEMVREGRSLLGEVPSQYGFLSILVLAVLPTDDRFTALFWLNGALVWVSGVIVYFTLRTWLARWWWQLGAGLITLCSVAFLCGFAPTLAGPVVYPSVGAVRFIWVHVMLGFLLWRHRAQSGTAGTDSRRTLWIGSTIWLLGVLWSVESAVYVTAAWFPAAALLAMRPVVGDLTVPARVRALIAGIGRVLSVTGLLLAAAVVLVAGYYHFVLRHSPDWHSYWEYATAFSGGFGVLPIERQGGVWVLVLLHTALLASIVSLEIDRQRSSVALVWAAWGTLWTVSTYYISRSHINNITNLGPVLLLIVGLMVHALATSSPRSVARPWIWLTVPSFVGAMLWLVLTNTSALRLQLTNYFVEPHTARLLPRTPPALAELIILCQQAKPGPYSVLGTSIVVMTAEIASDHRDWLPLRSMPLYNPLPEARQDFYLDSYNHGLAPGWLIASSVREADDLPWFFNYVETRYTPLITLNHQGWQAWYYLPRPGWKPPAPQP